MASRRAKSSVFMSNMEESSVPLGEKAVVSNIGACNALSRKAELDPTLCVFSDADKGSVVPTATLEFIVESRLILVPESKLFSEVGCRSDENSSASAAFSTKVTSEWLTTLWL